MACTFVDEPLRRWPTPITGSGAAIDVPLVLTDLHVVPRDRESLVAVAHRLVGSCDAVLVGDHAGARNDFPPSFVAAILLDAGIAPWVTLSCRDRNRVALGAELAALAALGVPGVHCVTGDWEGLAGDAGESKVFDLDCLRLVDAARSAGLTVSVAATPAAPPQALRPARLAEKVAAGAQVCLVNHCGGPARVATFVRAAQEAGADIPFVPCVAVAADPATMAGLARLPGVVVDEASVRPDGSADALDAAVATAAAMLAVDGVEGVNLSGSASARSVADSAALMAATGFELLRRAARR